jgi:hypothetical protein
MHMNGQILEFLAKATHKVRKECIGTHLEKFNMGLITCTLHTKVFL